MYLAAPTKGASLNFSSYEISFVSTSEKQPRAYNRFPSILISSSVAPQQVAIVVRELFKLGCYEVSLGDTTGIGTLCVFVILLIRKCLVVFYSRITKIGTPQNMREVLETLLAENVDFDKYAK